MIIVPYAMTYKGYFLHTILSLRIWQIILHRKRERNDVEKFNKCIFIMLAVVLIIFFFTKSAISYKEARDILENNNYSKIESFEPLEMPSAMSGSFKLDKGLARAYLYRGYKEGEGPYLLVSTKTGEIAKEKVSDRYLDDFIKDSKYSSLPSLYSAKPLRP